MARSIDRARRALRTVACLWLLGSASVGATVHEDGSTPDAWRVYDKTPAGACMESVADATLGGQVIAFDGNQRRNGYWLGGGNGANGWNNDTETPLVFRMFVGDWPSYRIDGEDDAGDKGRVIPSMSVNRYGAALARWMGLSVGDVEAVFPDLGRGSGDEWHDSHGLFAIT